MPIDCTTCPHKRNCINGAYCTKLGKYVQYKDAPVCQESSNN